MLTLELQADFLSTVLPLFRQKVADLAGRIVKSVILALHFGSYDVGKVFVAYVEVVQQAIPSCTLIQGTRDSFAILSTQLIVKGNQPSLADFSSRSYSSKEIVAGGNGVAVALTLLQRTVYLNQWIGLTKALLFL